MTKYVYYFNNNLNCIAKSTVPVNIDEYGNEYEQETSETHAIFTQLMGASYYGYSTENITPLSRVGFVDYQVVRLPTPIEELKANKKEMINIERGKQNSNPIIYENIQFDADEIAQQNVSAWMSTLAGGGTLPSGFTWRSYDNQDIPVDANFINGLGTAMTLRGTQLYQTSWIKKAEVDALTTVEQVNNYDVTTGW
jgi:hypothetical protein